MQRANSARQQDDGLVPVDDGHLVLVKGEHPVAELRAETLALGAQRSLQRTRRGHVVARLVSTGSAPLASPSGCAVPGLEHGLPADQLDSYRSPSRWSPVLTELPLAAQSPVLEASP